MLFRDIVSLISETNTVNEVGDLVPTETPKNVYANKKSIRQSEFYQAFAHGLKPELMFIVRSVDYSNEPRLTYNNKKYNIIRAYSKNDELTELICEGIVGTEVR